MSDTVIQVENLSKKYVLAHQEQGASYKTFREAMTNAAKFLASSLNPNGKKEANLNQEEFWALKNLSFEIKQGEVVGIIGRNGAGKSTLLKILSRITEPTSGSIRIQGRVASLLEVGTGFHPELTGRENIFLNGAILGMSKVEIQRKFDEIVAFAEIEKFLDTPVKRYSSGMYVRLAFAVAAHLEPEILIVDEVLAVGDAAFQKKCLGKMGDVVTKEGRTILFVSHNILAIKQLCNKGLFLEKGKLVINGNLENVINHYVSSRISKSGYWKRSEKITASFGIYFEEISITDSYGKIVDVVKGNEFFFLNITVRVCNYVDKAEMSVRIINKEDLIVFTTTSSDFQRKWMSFNEGICKYKIKFSSDFFYPGRYSTHLASFAPGKLFDELDAPVSFEIDELGNIVTDIADKRLGFVSPVFKWEEVKYEM
ncbi:ABC transporter-like protein [Kalymmatonema gypsitolerans NIES-4073]|nr:ABC transporter-like protein [Scytonema sp. NIES-4073]